MVDETDIGQEEKWFYQERAKATVSNLIKRRINAQYVPSCQDALSAVLEMIPQGATVARGDSITLEQVGVSDELRKRKQNKFIDPFASWYVRDAEGSTPVDWEQRFRMMRETFLADIFLTGTNAVTFDGKLVNIDYVGNRVAPMIFGPEKVIVVAGANKIVKDVDEALARIHGFAAPINAKRHYLKHNMPHFGNLPCVRTGRCIDCNHERKICNITVIIEGTFAGGKGRINVVLVGEKLGI